MFDIGWTEMVMIIIVMIVVVGPKELPRMLYHIGQWIGRVRRVARQFQDGIEQMAHQAGVDDLKKQIDSVSEYSIQEQVEKSMDPKGELADAFSVEAPKDETKKSDTTEPAVTPAKGDKA